MTLKTLSVEKELASPYLCLSHHADFPALRVSMGLWRQTPDARGLWLEPEKAGAEKAHVVPKPKRPEGFSSSIRRHRKSKVSGPEQSNPGAKESEGARARPHEYVSSALLSHTDEVFQAPKKRKCQNLKMSLGPKFLQYQRLLWQPLKAAFKDPEKTLETFVSALLQPKPAPEASGPEELHSPETGRSLWQEAIHPMAL